MINSQYIELLKRAFPHLDERKRQSINVILKLSELSDTINSCSIQNQLSACSTNNVQKTNSEELLKSIRPVCSKKEQEIIDMTLNFFKSREILSAYKKMTGDNGSITTFDMLKNQFSNEQIEIISQLSKLMNE